MNDPLSRKPGRLSYESKIILHAFFCAAPGVGLSCLLLYLNESKWEVWVTALVFLLVPIPFIAWRLQSWITNPLKVAVNILGSIREGDFTMRTRRVSESSGTIVELYREINDIANRLETSRTGGIETRHAIDKITANIDVATLIVDEHRSVVQANESARRLIASVTKWDADPIGRSVDELKIGFCLDASTSDFSRFSYRDADRRFEGRRGIFRMDGNRYDLIVLTDITKAASEQERESWKRLLRVLGHELNNSLAPISSLANTLSKIARAAEMDEETKSDMLVGLETISSRSDNIVRFMQDYTQLAKLPEPKKEIVALGPMVKKACQLHGEVVVFEPPAESPHVSADPAQLEQALINVIKNACEATRHEPYSVVCAMHSDSEQVSLSILDTGPGVSNTENLFVPFYTTKEKGSGIGLAISKQILEAVGGSLSLANRQDRAGCIATIRLSRV